MTDNSSCPYNSTKEPRKSARRPMTTKVLVSCCVLFFLGSAALWGAPIQLRVTAEQANIREKPDITSAVILQVPEGTLLEAETKQGEWFAVRIAQDTGGFLSGYVHESLVMAIEAPEEKEEVKEIPEEKPAEPETKEPTAVPSQAQAPRTPPASKPRAERLHVSLWFGGRYASVGDLNAGAKGMAQTYEDTLGVSGEGTVGFLHLGYVYGIEIWLPLVSRFFFSFGAEYYSGEKPSSVSFTAGASQDFYVTEPRVQAVPISVSLVCYPLSYIYVKAGLEYTFASCGYLYRSEQTDSWQEWAGSASSSGLGYQVGLGAEWRPFSHVSLLAEACYRHLHIGALEGENNYRQSDGSASREEGKLYYYEVASNGGGRIPLVLVRENEPSGTEVLDYRNAMLGLSGLSLRAGIKIEF